MENVTNIANNNENLPLIQRIAEYTRIGRGKSIKNSFVTSLAVSKNRWPVEVSASVQSSYSGEYVVYFRVEENGSGTVVHDCPDFKGRRRPCKHLVKVLLVINKQACETICEHYYRLSLQTDPSMVDHRKKDAERQKAQKLVSAGDVAGALEALEKAGDLDEAMRIACDAEVYDKVLLFLEKGGTLPAKTDLTIRDILDKPLHGIPACPVAKQLAIAESIISLGKSGTPSLDLDDLINMPSFISAPAYIRGFLLEKIGASTAEQIAKVFQDLNLPPRLPAQKLKDEWHARLAEICNQKIFAAIAEFRDWNEIRALQGILAGIGGTLPDKTAKMVTKYQTDLHNLKLSGLRRKFEYLKTLCIAINNATFIRQLSLGSPYYQRDFFMGGVQKSDAPLTKYILDKCGFLESHPDYITRQDLVQNYPILAELFKVQTLAPEAHQFWGPDYDKVTSIVRDKTEEIELIIDWKTAKRECVLVEWDLTHYPIQGSHIAAYKDGYMIPLQGDPLTEDLEPFEVTLCLQNPVLIRDNVKVLKPLRKVPLAEVIRGVYEGVSHVGSFLPFEVIRQLRQKEIDPYTAWARVYDALSGKFVPTRVDFEKEFTRFLNSRIASDLEVFYSDLKAKVTNAKDFREMASRLGGVTALAKIFADPALTPFCNRTRLHFPSLASFKRELYREVSRILIDRIKRNPPDPNGVQVDQLLKFSQFQRLAAYIISARKEEFINVKISKRGPKDFGVEELQKTIYGRKILFEALGTETLSRPASQEEMDEIMAVSKFLNLPLTIE